MGDRISMSKSGDSLSDDPFNRGPLALFLRRQYEFPSWIKINNYSIFIFFPFSVLISFHCNLKLTEALSHIIVKSMFAFHLIVHDPGYVRHQDVIHVMTLKNKVRYKSNKEKSRFTNVNIIEVIRLHFFTNFLFQKKKTLFFTKWRPKG